VRSIGRLLEIVRLITVEFRHKNTDTLISMKIFVKLPSIFLLLTVGLLVSCGGGGTSITSTTLKGYVVDSPVQGLSYTCGALIGTTGSDGSFTYVPGSACTFKIGNVTVGEINSTPTDGIVTPHDLAGVSRADSSNASAVVIAQFLQSLDDGTSNGVLKIPNSFATALANVQSRKIVDGNSTITQGDLSQLVSTASGNTKTLVSSASANDAMNTYIRTVYPNLDASKGIITTSSSVTPTLLTTFPDTTLYEYTMQYYNPDCTTPWCNKIYMTVKTDIESVGYWIASTSSSYPVASAVIAGAFENHGSVSISAGTNTLLDISGIDYYSILPQDVYIYFVVVNANDTSKVSAVYKTTLADPPPPVFILNPDGTMYFNSNGRSVCLSHCT
jgi:hypothetical protein